MANRSDRGRGQPAVMSRASKPAKQNGTSSAETIKASGHDRANRPYTRLHPTSTPNPHRPLAMREPSTQDIRLDQRSSEFDLWRADFPRSPGRHAGVLEPASARTTRTICGHARHATGRGNLPSVTFAGFHQPRRLGRPIRREALVAPAHIAVVLCAGASSHRRRAGGPRCLPELFVPDSGCI